MGTTKHASPQQIIYQYHKSHILGPKHIYQTCHPNHLQVHVYCHFSLSVCVMVTDAACQVRI